MTRDYVVVSQRVANARSAKRVERNNLILSLLSVPNHGLKTQRDIAKKVGASESTIRDAMDELSFDGFVARTKDWRWAWKKYAPWEITDKGRQHLEELGK